MGGWIMVVFRINWRSIRMSDRAAQSLCYALRVCNRATSARRLPWPRRAMALRVCVLTRGSRLRSPNDGAPHLICDCFDCRGGRAGRSHEDCDSAHVDVTGVHGQLFPRISRSIRIADGGGSIGRSAWRFKGIAAGVWAQRAQPTNLECNISDDWPVFSFVRLISRVLRRLTETPCRDGAARSDPEVFKAGAFSEERMPRLIHSIFWN